MSAFHTYFKVRIATEAQKRPNKECWKRTDAAAIVAPYDRVAPQESLQSGVRGSTGVTRQRNFLIRPNPNNAMVQYSEKILIF